MVMKDCLEKNVQKKVLIEKHREYYLVLDEETGAIFLVNETSHFLYENCDGQSVESLCELLFDQCIDKDQLDKRTVYEGCTKVLRTSPISKKRESKGPSLVPSAKARPPKYSRSGSLG